MTRPPSPRLKHTPAPIRDSASTLQRGAGLRSGIVGARRLGWPLLALLLIIAIIAALLVARAFLAGPDPALAQIQQSGVWRVGMDPSFPPFEALDPATGQPAGFDVDLARAIAARWGVRVEIVSAGFDELLDAVAAGRVDSAVSALPYVDYRTAEVAFSTPYLEAGLVLAVPPGSAISAAGDLAGRRVAAEWGSEGDAEARALQKTATPAPQLVLKESAAEALAAVASGAADAAIVDAVSLALYRRDGGRLVPLDPPLRSNPYVIVLPRHSPRLLARINETLAALQADGTLDALHARWLGPP